MTESNLAERIEVVIRTRPEAMAIDFNGKIYSWQFVGNLINTLGNLFNEAGIRHQERVGFVAHTRPHHVACLWGFFVHGRVPSMIYGYQSPQKIASDIRQLRYPLIVADERDWTNETIAAAMECGSAGISISDTAVRWVEGLEQVGEGVDRTVLPGIAVETLSSGTTGAPKRIDLAMNNLQVSAEAAVASIENMQGKGSESPLIIALPLGNISGVYASTPPALMGVPIALMEKFDITVWLEFVKRYQPITADVPPAAMAMLYKQGIGREVLRSVKVIRTGAAPLDRKVHDYFADELGIPVNLSYGASEFCGVVTTWMLEELELYGKSKRGSCGRALPGIELRAVDRDSGEILPTGAVGLLEVKADRVSPDWIRTSDLVLLDDDGFMWFKGRADDTIFRGGFKLSPEAIAEALRHHPAIVDCGVVGIPDERLGEVPIAALQLKPGYEQLSNEKIKAFAREVLGAHQIPVDFVWLPELPRTASLKLRTVELKSKVLKLLAGKE